MEFNRWTSEASIRTMVWLVHQQAWQPQVAIVGCGRRGYVPSRSRRTLRRRSRKRAAKQSTCLRPQQRAALQPAGRYGTRGGRHCQSGAQRSGTATEGALEPAVRVRAVAEARAALLHTAKDCQTGCQERPRPASTRRQLLASTRAGLALITNQMRRMGQPKRWLSVKPTAQHADVATICEGRQAGQARMGPRKPLPSWEQKDSASATAQRPRAGPLQAQAHQHPAPVPRKHMPAACQWALSVLPSRPCIYTLVSTMPWQLPGTDPFPHRLAQPAGLLGAQQHSVHHGGGGIQRHEQRDERQHLQGKRGASKAGDQEGKGAHARGSCL